MFKTTRLLTYKEECALGKRIQAGDIEARNELIMRNQNFIHHVAQRYVSTGMPYEDLVSLGNLGLIRAAGKFDPKRKIKFSTYAMAWVRSFMQRGITNELTNVRLPIGSREVYNRYEKVYRHIEMTTGNKPTISECAKLMRVKTSKLRLIIENVPTVIHLDSLEHDDTFPLKAPIHDIDTTIMIEQIFKKSKLTEGEKQVLVMKYLRDMTLADIGRYYGYTRENARLVLVKTLKKIRKEMRLETKRKSSGTKSKN